MKVILGKRLTTALVCITALLVVCGVLVWRMDVADRAWAASPGSSNSQRVSHAGAAAELPDTQKLVGRWLRTDSLYVIEISEVSPDGTLRAGYYNPRPINVSAAKVNRKDGTVKVFVELHDAGYPGSNYTLNYNPQNDLLEGTYFQATLQENYSVAFIRMPAEH